MRLIKLLILLSVGTLWAWSSSLAQTSGGGPFSHSSPLNITDNGANSCFPYKAIFSNVSCSGGVATITTGTGTVTSVATDASMTGGPITSTGTLGVNWANATQLNTTGINWSNLDTLNGNQTITGTKTFATAASLGSSTATTQSANDNSTKIATTAYTDNAVLGQNYKEAVGAATTANLVGTYLNGTSGVGATFTYTSTGVDTIDGVTLTLGMRVLLKNQTTTFQNGIYTVTTAGDLAVAGILTRATDANQSAQYKTGDAVFVTAGTVGLNTTWAYTGIDSPTMGTTAITFAQIAGQGSFTGSVVQVVNTQTGSYSTGTTALPIDNTIPQNTEGTEFMTLAITPKSSSNLLKIDVVMNLGSVSGVDRPAMALFQDTTVGALAATRIGEANSGWEAAASMTDWMAAGTTSSTTFMVRAGNNAGNTVYFNGSAASGGLFGGVNISSITITEIKA